MSCSKKQAKLIDDLMTAGAPIPCKGDGGDPDFSMYDSVKAADAYIKEHYHILKTPKTDTAPGDWGGIPNH